MAGQGAPVTVTNWGTVSGAAPGSSAATTTFEKSVGSDNINTTQVATGVAGTNATQVVAARSGRRSVTFTNITGAQPVYFTDTNRTTGATTGFFLAGTVGASVTISTSAAIFAASPTAAQTLGVLETF